MVAFPAAEDHLVRVKCFCDEDSEDVGTPLERGTRLQVLETRTLAAGTKRAHVILKGMMVPHGWITLQSRAGKPILQPLFARPFYEVVYPPVVRKRFDLTSEVLVTLARGTRLHVLDSRRTNDGSQRVLVALVGSDAELGWLTARKCNHGTVTIREMIENPVEPVELSRMLPPDGCHPVSARLYTPRSARGPRILSEKAADPIPLPMLQPRRHSAHTIAGIRSGSPRSIHCPTTSSCSVKKEGQGGFRRSQSSSSPMICSNVPAQDPSPPAACTVGEGEGQTRESDHTMARHDSIRAKSMDRRGLASSAPLMAASAVEEIATNFRQQALEQEALLDESKMPLSVKIGTALATTKMTVGQMVTSWARRGEEPISKMEFRQHVRKLLGKPDVKQIDALFESLDEDHGGTLDVSELKNALKTLQVQALDRASKSSHLRALADKYHEHGKQASEVAIATAAFEKASQELDELRGNKTVAAQIGDCLSRKSMKVGELVMLWDKNGNGEVDKGEFRKSVKGMGVEAPTHEIDELFDSLDDDGGGTLDLSELKRALKTLQERSSESDKVIVQLKKSTAEQSKSVKASQVELKAFVQKIEEEKADEEARAAAKKVEEEERKAAAKLARLEAIEAKRAAAAAEKVWHTLAASEHR